MQFALLISVIVAILLSAFLLLTHVQSFFRIKSQELITASDLVHQHLVASLSAPKISKDTIETNIDQSTLKLMSSYHGAWLKTVSKVTIRNKSMAKTAYTGSPLDPKSPNLYLANKNAPLVVVGDTRLEGNSYLPKQGIKAGNISGNYYQGSSLFYGRSMESKEQIPDLDPAWIQYLTSLSTGALIDENSIISLEREIKNSFHKPSKIIYSNQTMLLGNETISGNVVIQSTSKIIVTAAANLTDVVLIAPTIELHNNVKGRMQLIATKKIHIGKRCHLSYPSSVILIDKTIVPTNTQGNNAQNRIAMLAIDTNAKIEGTVTYLNNAKKTQNRIKTHIKVEKNAEIIGEIYCQGNIDFQGVVKGSLYTNQFIANQSGSVYLNHLYNGKVLRNPIADYAGLSFKNSKKKVAKWLY